jgi:hypothetical protein
LKSISVPASIESLGDECFAECLLLSSVKFESESNLLRIHTRAFLSCWSLKSILIPRSIGELVKDWALECSLRHVTFESAASLQRMIDGDSVDLSERFTIKIENCDTDIDSLGSSIGRRCNHFSHLVHWEAFPSVKQSCGNYHDCLINTFMIDSITDSNIILIEARDSW